MTCAAPGGGERPRHHGRAALHMLGWAGQIKQIGINWADQLTTKGVAASGQQKGTPGYKGEGGGRGSGMGMSHMSLGGGIGS